MNQIKKLFPAFALMFSLGMNPVCSLAAEVNVIPTPVKLTQQRGEFIFPSSLGISYNTEEGKAIAGYLAQKIYIPIVY